MKRTKIKPVDYSIKTNDVTNYLFLITYPTAWRVSLAFVQVSFQEVGTWEVNEGYKRGENTIIWAGGETALTS